MLKSMTLKLFSITLLLVLISGNSYSEEIILENFLLNNVPTELDYELLTLKQSKSINEYELHIHSIISKINNDEISYKEGILQLRQNISSILNNSNKELKNINLNKYINYENILIKKIASQVSLIKKNNPITNLNNLYLKTYKIIEDNKLLAFEAYLDEEPDQFSLSHSSWEFKLKQRCPKLKTPWVLEDNSPIEERFITILTFEFLKQERMKKIEKYCEFDNTATLALKNYIESLFSNPAELDTNDVKLTASLVKTLGDNYDFYSEILKRNYKKVIEERGEKKLIINFFKNYMTSPEGKSLGSSAFSTLEKLISRTHAGSVTAILEQIVILDIANKLLREDKYKINLKGRNYFKFSDNRVFALKELQNNINNIENTEEIISILPNNLDTYTKLYLQKALVKNNSLQIDGLLINNDELSKDHFTTKYKRYEQLLLSAEHSKRIFKSNINRKSYKVITDIILKALSLRSDNYISYNIFQTIQKDSLQNQSFDSEIKRPMIISGSESKKQLKLHPDIITPSIAGRDLIIRGFEKVSFHPLSIIYAPNSNVTIEANIIDSPLVDTSLTKYYRKINNTSHITLKANKIINDMPILIDNIIPTKTEIHNIYIK